MGEPLLACLEVTKQGVVGLTEWPATVHNDPQPPKPAPSVSELRGGRLCDLSRCACERADPPGL
jgi:hypothetical protein